MPIRWSIWTVEDICFHNGGKISMGNKGTDVCSRPPSATIGGSPKGRGLPAGYHTSWDLSGWLRALLPSLPPSLPPSS